MHPSRGNANNEASENLGKTESGTDKVVLRASKILVYKEVHEFCETRKNVFRCAAIRLSKLQWDYSASLRSLRQSAKADRRSSARLCLVVGPLLRGSKSVANYNYKKSHPKGGFF